MYHKERGTRVQCLDGARISKVNSMRQTELSTKEVNNWYFYKVSGSVNKSKFNRQKLCYNELFMFESIIIYRPYWNLDLLWLIRNII